MTLTRQKLDSHTHTHTHEPKKVIKREMCAVFKRTHSGTKLQTELHFLAHRINHLHFLLEQCTRGAGGGEPIMPFKMGPNHHYSLSRHDCTPPSWVSRRYLFFFFSALKDVECGSERRRKRSEGEGKDEKKG